MGCTGCGEPKLNMKPVNPGYERCHYLAEVRGITLYLPATTASGCMLTPDGFIHGDILMVGQRDGLWSSGNIANNLRIGGGDHLELALSFENETDSTLRFWATDGAGKNVDLFVQRMRIRRPCRGPMEFTINHASGTARGAGGSIKLRPVKR